ncbi:MULTISPECIES: bifunctional 2-C-methyl-D-erythritol 4-phosphate cytidylyltransferase/2-C-methyl-D-erythritol 2,4-cyclodiphosphate synthase [unclassified Aureimonas]|uniref:bifunctional 2-C-methyl-D-erythritol 4-phosphate cytidylyltransferase/2-C-methyl-D-erythritol 2,4-cyclodiphosphate synthase n=1 Tax=unclassified Aureimonas TaxID=2615206 RepID=UPI0006F8A8DA|nr:MULTISPECIES: bifunctional 2-C-methyl-D-erythritol 4-phosphate cytidylyltransferase/2-C-methyl-D-erythritol 2,4-cyclodiphosphate synthase [unclassified Aureimonas]KQT60341.1 2-C-methyl-D-erythritol 4-phosphate cytidylyltransferase [Aureimonas sp. Leaf427]KQT79217.1 2-C-methyl-D-erythritol 4-phosphate cytidylyltransferase [Aureimonas sp. Leaf460]
MSASSIAVLIVAAGRGERAGDPGLGPKQYRRLAGRSVLRRTLEAFAEAGLTDMIVAIHRDDDLLFAEALDDLPRPRVVTGGATRQDSVRLGLEALAADAPDIVLIHDAARPFVSPWTIKGVIDAVRETDGGALPGLALTDTLKRAGSSGLHVAETVPREGLFAAQTPQGFPFAAILEAHRQAASAGRRDFTDDAAIAEWRGLRVTLVEGTVANIKLTRPDDFVRAAAMLSQGAPMIDVRTGNGYDVHQLVAGDHVTLCGVRIPHDQALSGHSDADVGLHALTDALLATCGAGDIGDHFPPSDMQWRGAASHIFVRRAVELVAAAGGRIMNADISLICEAPKIAPHREAMRRAVAEMTGLDLTRVSVKATTNETIGFVGRREGIAAIATASVSYGEAP